MASDFDSHAAAELHPEAQSVLDLMESANAPPVHALSVEGARDRMKRLFATDADPEPVGAVDEYSIAGPDSEIPLRVYRPTGEGPHRTLVWFHGGGFVLGDLETADPLCRALSNEADATVVSVDYRLAPEHPWPAAPEDCYAATEWAVEHAGVLDGDPDRVAIGGTSAGGNLASVVALMARDRDGPPIAHQLLVYPSTHNDLRGVTDSYEENGEGYLLERQDSEWFRSQYFARDIDASHPYAFALQARSVDGLPPATVVTAGFDPLRDEGVAYAERLDDAGVSVVHRHYPDTIHGFFGMVGAQELDHARAAVREAGEDLRDFV